MDLNVKTSRYTTHFSAFVFQTGYVCFHFWCFFVRQCFRRLFIAWSTRQIKSLFIGLCFLNLSIWLGFFGISGYIIWALSCYLFCQKPYSFLKYATRLPSPRPKTISITSVNISSDKPFFLESFRTLYESENRLGAIGRLILEQIPVPFINISNDRNSKKILSRFPQTDILCFQNLLGRTESLILIQLLSRKYGYFLYDVGQSSWKINKYLLGSGLLIASRYRIIAADFYAFTPLVGTTKYISHGALCFSIELYRGRDQLRRIGYITTFCTQEGNGICTYNTLTELMCFSKNFKTITKKPSDIIAFDVLCGDTRAIFLKGAFQHPIFNLYKAPVPPQSSDLKDISSNSQVKRLQSVQENLAVVARDSDCKKRSSEEEADENGNPFQNGSNQILVSPAPAYAIGYSYTNALKKLTYQKPVTVVLNLARLYTDSGMSEQVLYGGREKS